MGNDSLNPFRPPSSLGQVAVLPGASRRLEQGLLWRKIEIFEPFRSVLTYTAWNFRQRIYLDQTCIWSQISWVTIRRRLTAPVPSPFAEHPLQLGIEIDFGPALFMRDFRVFIEDQLIYHESG